MEAYELIELNTNENISEFQSGDTVKVSTKVTEGDRERTQVFEGVVIRKRGGNGPAGSFTVRKVSHDIGIEKTFHIHSATVEGVEVVRKGKVRRARLTYLRDRSGKSARIKERR
tara:strand:+ start:210 stop:551 length:342 start_codon:yes stop_codon:yes gene_type:complete